MTSRTLPSAAPAGREIIGTRFAPAETAGALLAPVSAGDAVEEAGRAADPPVVGEGGDVEPGDRRPSRATSPSLG